ncbi:hypothetical protein CBR_g2916 [Chara braunii]|uniref:(S)-ureidoglycine aminohydrolase cupin domain-containing protein n=1 Tax=Chara braunii TaxID=69332 RepID=A0A388KEJ3_CHABU|nr:hypothetical protein CBR_g2916 [Chara braunii]|eukprot:GBG68373.1 hypothetical protein CBR_g2916 [Chara braunii]
MAITTLCAALKLPAPAAVGCAPSKGGLPSISSPAAHFASSAASESFSLAGRISSPAPADCFPRLRRLTTTASGDRTVIQSFNCSPRTLNGAPSATRCVPCSADKGNIGKRRTSSSLGSSPTTRFAVWGDAEKARVRSDQQSSGSGRGVLSHCRGVESRRRRRRLVVRAMASDGKVTETQVEDKLGIRVEHNPSEERLKEMGVRQWPKWGCPPSKFPWTYDAKETCYVLKGKVYVTPEGQEDSVAIGAGDLVVFPKGMSCTWDVQVAVDKHYNFE